MALLSDKDINVYFMKCIEFCLLMVATDPPIVLVCPGWEVTHTPDTKDTTTNGSISAEENVSYNVENDTSICLPAQQSQIDDEKRQTIGIKEPFIYVFDVITNEHQSEQEKSSEKQITDVIDRNESASPNTKKHNEDCSLQEHVQGKIDQQEDEKDYDGTGTEDCLSIDADAEKQHPPEAEFLGESYVAGHSSTGDSVVVNPSQVVGQQTEHQEREPMIPDYEIIGKDELIDTQQSDHLKQRHSGGIDITNEGIKQTIPIMTEILLFDKELFKEYTRRGKYLDYIVWPAMCLHKDGALLSKGVAQGSKFKGRVQNDEVWTWRR